jgi:homoserine dehydrogenase
MHRLGLTNLTVNYLLSKAAADKKSFAQIIDELVRKDMASVSV